MGETAPIAPPPPGSITVADGGWLLVAPADSPPSITLVPASLNPPTLDQATRITAAFERDRSINPRLFDGLVVLAELIDPATHAITASLGRFSRIAAQPEIDTDAVVIGLSALLTMTHDGERRVLIAQRSPCTRIYGGLWECAPSGVLDASELSALGPIPTEGVTATFLAELNEELGIVAANLIAPPTFRGVCYDPIAQSLELIVHAELAEDAPMRHGDDRWEYMDTRWISIEDAEHHAAAAADKLIPPTALMLANLPLLLPA